MNPLPRTSQPRHSRARHAECLTCAVAISEVALPYLTDASARWLDTDASQCSRSAEGARHAHVGTEGQDVHPVHDSHASFFTASSYHNFDSGTQICSLPCKRVQRPKAIVTFRNLERAAESLNATSPRPTLLYLWARPVTRISSVCLAEARWTVDGPAGTSKILGVGHFRFSQAAAANALSSARTALRGAPHATSLRCVGR